MAGADPAKRPRLLIIWHQAEYRQQLAELTDDELWEFEDRLCAEALRRVVDTTAKLDARRLTPEQVPRPVQAA